MSLNLSWFLFTTTEALFVMRDAARNRNVGCFMFGASQVRAILNQHIGNPNTHEWVLRSLGKAALPELAPRPFLWLEGDYVAHLTRIFAASDESKGVQMVLGGERVRNRLLFCLLPPDDQLHDGLFGFADQEHNDSLLVLYSKEQGRRFLASRPWKPKQDRDTFSRTLESSGLPEQAASGTVTISGELAIWFNRTFLLTERQRRTTN